jgi:uncharacterized membrane protein (UPF0127 family)
MNKKSISCSEGLLLKNCSSIHCMFMKFPIDVIYLSEDMKILEIETVYPWKIGKSVKNTAHVLELHKGIAKRKAFIGDILRTS